MSEVPKRWHLPRYLLFPLIVATLLLVAAKLVALERADLIARLVDEIAHGDTQSATAAVRQLAAMPRPPFDRLVEAAASPNAVISGEAQAAIADCLRRLQRNIAADRRVDATAKELAVITASLTRHQQSFADRDNAWLGKTTRKIIRLANRLPSQSTPLLASQCDAILASLRPSAVATTTFVAEESDNVTAIPTVTEMAVAASPALPMAAEQVQRHINDRFAALSDRPFPAAASVSPSETETSSSGAVLPATTQELSSLRETPANPGFEGEAAWKPEWTHPMFFSVPAMPIDTIPLPRNATPAAINPLRPRPTADTDDSAHDSSENAAAHDEALISVSSRELLARWAAADDGEVVGLEHELTTRGFEGISERLVERLFSDDVEERLGLIDDILTQPSTDARRWLLLLAEDPSADVRLVVVTIMATSNDSELIEKAWQVAIHDRDPRIAALAARLRERRAAIESY